MQYIGFIIIVVVGLIMGKIIGGSIGKKQGEAAAYRLQEQRKAESKEDSDEVFRKGYREGMMEFIENSYDMYPIMIDSITRQDGVSLSNDTLNNYFTIIDDAIFERPLSEIKQENQKEIARNICNAKEIRQGLDAGFSFAYHYADTKGREIMTFTISKKDCL